MNAKRKCTAPTTQAVEKRRLREKMAAAVMGHREVPPQGPSDRANRLKLTWRLRMPEAPRRSAVVVVRTGASLLVGIATVTSTEAPHSTGVETSRWWEPTTPLYTSLSGPGRAEASAAALRTLSRWMRVVPTWFGSTLRSRTGALQAAPRVMRDDGSFPSLPRARSCLRTSISSPKWES